MTESMMINDLSPEKRRLLDLLLEEEGVPPAALARLEQTPRNEIEEALVKIWSEVLKVEPVGIHDDFFELGGDSIQSIQIVARANQAGLSLTTRQIFEHPTISDLAKLASKAPAQVASSQPVIGQIPLTPIQRWFFEQELPNPHHWNQAVLLEVEQDIDLSHLTGALQRLLDHHDALRIRFSNTESGWRQRNEGIGEEILVQQIDLSGLPADEQERAIESHASEIQGGLNLCDGPLLKAAVFKLGAVRTCRLLIVVHHLVVDGVSMRILIEDLQTVYQRLLDGGSAQLPPKTTSFLQWAHLLEEQANSPQVQQDLDYWLKTLSVPAARGPIDHCRGMNLEASGQVVSITLNAEETNSLLQKSPGAFNAQIGEALLTALLQALAEWTGETFFLLDLEGHGRDELGQGEDLSRTVGWFTTVFPALFHFKTGSDLTLALRSVKEQLREVSGRGRSYGLLRYLSGSQEAVPRLKSLPQPELIFNYLGQFKPVSAWSRPWRLARESCGMSRCPDGERSHLIQVIGGVFEDRLKVDWVYSENFHRRTTVEKLAAAFGETLRALIREAEFTAGHGLSPSDFPEAELSQAELERLLSGMK
jgi:non-ribosomal peptide synthase protein (TIGR01720 family)